VNLFKNHVRGNYNLTILTGKHDKSFPDHLNQTALFCNRSNSGSLVRKQGHMSEI